MSSRAEIMRFAAAPRDISAYVSGFAYRMDERGGDVVIVLPQPRPTVQLMLADPYWLREADRDAPWRRLPRVALWGPRLVRGYGFAARRIHSYGFSLTSAGVRALTGRPPGAFVNMTIDLAHADIGLSSELFEAGLELEFDAWVSAVCGIFRTRVVCAPVASPLAAAFDVLALADADSIVEVAQGAGLSERQFRRLFSSEFGAPAKTYQRLLRFDRTLRALHPQPWESPHPDGAGRYADQPHLIREFRAIGGITPGAYVRSKERHGDRILRSVVVNDVPPPEF